MASLPKSNLSKESLTAAVILLCCWGSTWWRQHFVWNSLPEYQYGWIVPLLVFFFLIEKWHSRPSPSKASHPLTWYALILTGLAVLCLGRVFLEPFPHWTGMLWCVTLGSLSISLGVAGKIGGVAWLRHFSFPFAFALLALPWPEFLKQQFLDRLSPLVSLISASVVTELGYPAVCRGNVIEVATGLLGVDEACSGIRSIQSTFMVAIFLGEYYRFTIGRRLTLVVLGVVFAFGANLLRTSFLTWETATQGHLALGKYHDSAGYLTLALTACGMAAVTWYWVRKETLKDSAVTPTAPDPVATGGIPVAFAALAIALPLVSELATKAWFDLHASTVANPISWTVTFPKNSPGFEKIAISGEAIEILRCDKAEGASWRNSQGAKFTGFFVRWIHGHNAQYAALEHNPRICFPMFGLRLVQELGLVEAKIGKQTVPFHALRFDDGGREFNAYFCAIDTSTGLPLQPPFQDRAEILAWRWRQIVEGKRHLDAQLLTLAVWKAPGSDLDDLSLFQSELAQITQVQAPTP